MIINKKYLKQYSVLPLNYDLTEVSNYIDISEKIWVLPVLGDDLYDEICEQVENDNLTPENSTLLTEAVWPLLGFAVCLESLPFLWSHVSSVGVTKGFSDNSESLTLKDLTLIQQHLRNQTETRKQFLYKWLKGRADSFPLWNGGCECNSCCDTKPKQNSIMGVYGMRHKCTDLK